MGICIHTCVYVCVSVCVCTYASMWSLFICTTQNQCLHTILTGFRSTILDTQHYTEHTLNTYIADHEDGAWFGETEMIMLISISLSTQ